MSDGTLDLLLIAFTVAGVVFVEVLIYRDLTARRVDPALVMVLMVVFWPVGLYLWIKRRREHPHPEYVV